MLDYLEEVEFDTEVMEERGGNDTGCNKVTATLIQTHQQTYAEFVGEMLSMGAAMNAKDARREEAEASAARKKARKDADNALKITQPSYIKAKVNPRQQLERDIQDNRGACLKITPKYPRLELKLDTLESRPPSRLIAVPTVEGYLIELEKHNWLSDTSRAEDKLHILDVFTGVGKTEKVIQLMCRSLVNKTARLTYACRSIQEAVEVLLRMRRVAVREEKDNKNRQIRNALDRSLNNSYIPVTKHREVPKETKKKEVVLPNRGFLGFNFDGSKDEFLAKVEDILADKSHWTPEEIAFVRKLKCGTPHSYVDSRVMITTHESLKLHPEYHKDRLVIIDEVPLWAMQVVKVGEGISAGDTASVYKHMVEAYGDSVHPLQDPSKIANAVAQGLLRVVDLPEGNQAFVLSTTPPFKLCVVMTAFARNTSLEEVAYLQGDFFTPPFIQVNENISHVLRAIDNIEYENPDFKQVVTTSLKATKFTCDWINNRFKCRNAEDFLTVATASQEPYIRAMTAGTQENHTKNMAGWIAKTVFIKTNCVGSNSYSHLKNVILLTQLNMSNAEKGWRIKLYGKAMADNIEARRAGANLTQSLFRSCIRKNEKVSVTTCSLTCKERVINNIKSYLMEEACKLGKAKEEVLLKADSTPLDAVSPPPTTTT